MFKKSLTMVLSVIMILGMGTTTLAADTIALEKEIGETTTDDLIKDLNSIDFGREVTFTALPQSQLNDQNLLKFDSVEEAEMFLKQFMAESTKLAMPTGTVEQSHIQPQFNMGSLAAIRRDGTYNTTVSWWGGGNTSLLSRTNVEITYTIKRGRVSHIDVHDSYMTGIVGASWTHKSGYGMPKGGMDTEYSVTGVWFIGFDIKGFPAGASFHSTLKSPTITL